MFEVIKGLRSILKACEIVVPGQRILVIADNEAYSTWLGQYVMNTAASMGAEAVLMIIDPPEMRGAEPPAPVTAAMKNANVSIRITDKAALVHSTARKEATALGARYCTIDNIPLEHIITGASARGIRTIAERTEKTARLLDSTRAVRVTTTAGTDITLSIENRKAIPLHPLSPVVAGVPYYAEAASAPVEGTAQGRLVLDLGFINWVYLLNQPIVLEVKDGKVHKIISGVKADIGKLNAALSGYENASNIAEFGIGTSHIVPLPMRGNRQDAARLGTVHFALGRNNDIGGNTLSKVHWDMLIGEATIEMDDRCIMKKGTLLI